MKKLCIVYNFAPLYREAIFRLIDNEWDCSWYFGHNTTDIKEMPIDVLKQVTYVDKWPIVKQIEWQKGIGKLIRDKRFGQYLMLGDLMCLSTWWMLIQRRLFYRKKCIYLWTHGWYGRESFVKKWIKRIFFGMSDHVFTYGEYARQEAIKQGFNGLKVTPIHNSLNHTLQVQLRNQLTPSSLYKDHFKNDNHTLIFIGRLTKVKKLDMLILALHQLKNKGEVYNLVLIGTGEEHETLVRLSEILNIENQVWFYGGCYDDYLNASLIYNADLCIAPGNVGLTAMHAMVFGCPVISHNDFRHQMPEFESIKKGITGDFFQYGDFKSLANTISQWFATKANCREVIRQECFKVIDTEWTPEFQLNILKMKIQ